MFMIWIENHLILLGLLAVVSGVGLGVLVSATRRHADPGDASPRRSAGSSGVGGRSSPGTGSARPRYQARSW